MTRNLSIVFAKGARVTHDGDPGFPQTYFLLTNTCLST